MSKVNNKLRKLLIVQMDWQTFTPSKEKVSLESNMEKCDKPIKKWANSVDMFCMEKCHKQSPINRYSSVLTIKYKLK